MSKHVVVDGSNLATEGRSMPSLKQLNEAVLAYVEDHPDATITVVVDATFGHRIDPREVAEFDAAIEHNELVAPPAGAIGRGDAFVLMIAMKANATILSNDSFQEFHGEHPWLFEDDRLVGGKPVPHVGWVFVARSPVRGAISRRAVKAKKTGERPSSRRPRAAAARVSSDLANQPMPVPKMPPPVAARSSAPVTEAPVPAAAVAAPTPARVASANDLLAFLTFVERHPVGSLIGATIESYSSHGAYADCDGVKVYAPLRLMGEPAPRSAREVLKLGEERSFTVASFNPSRRSIDIALSTESVPMTSETTAPVGGPKAKKATRRKAPTPIVEVVTVDEPAPAKKTPVKKVPAKKASAKKAPEPVLAPVAAPAEPQVPAKKAQAKKVAAKAPAAKVPMTTSPPKKVPAKKVPAKKVPAKKMPAKKVPAKKMPAKKAAASPVPAPVVEPAAAPVKRAAAKKASTAPVKKAAPPTKAAVPVSKMAAPVKKAATAPAKKAAAPAAKKAAATKKK